MFDLKRAIQEWKRGLRRIESFEDGYIIELESHLLDEFDVQKRSGLSDEEAFAKAAALVGRPESIASDYFKTNTRSLSGRPPWESRRFLPALFWNYSKIAFRKLRRQKVYSFINIAGLAVGLAFFLLVISYVRDELLFDRFHAGSDRIFQVLIKIGPFAAGTSTSPPMAEALTSEFPEIRRSVRFWRMDHAVGRGDKILMQDVGYADQTLFDVFSFPLEKGNEAQALNSPDKVVLGREAVLRFFGNQDPLGQIISININEKKKDFQVSGVLKDIPRNSSLRFELLIPFDNVKLTFDMAFEDSLVTAPMFHATFLELHDGREDKALKEKFQAFLDRHYGDDLRKYKLDPKDSMIGLQKFTEYHLGDVRGSAALEPRSRPANSLILAGIAFLTLLLACFNYMNLSIGQSLCRIKEVGVRKTSGASRIHIIRQFLTGSLVLSLLALALGFLLAAMFLPRFNTFTGRSLSISFFLQGPNILLIVVLTLFVSLAAGSYPALVLSRLNPTQILRNKAGLGGTNILGRILVVFQFGISIFFVIGTLVMIGQLRLIETQDLGYDPKNVIMVPTYSFWFGADSGERTLEIFKNELGSRPQILSVSGASGTLNAGWNPSWIAPLIKDGEEIRISLFRVDPDFLRTMGIVLVQGRNFSPDYPTDRTESVLVNEAFVLRFGLRDPVGKRFSDFAQDPRPPGSEFKAVIIGVVKDYRFASLREEIGPLVLSCNANEERFLYVLAKATPEGVPGAISLLRSTWAKVQPDKPFHYYFLEDILAGQYERERNWGNIVGFSAGFAVFIACIGLFGLTSLTIARRTKEIGIRKVLGSSIGGILALVNRDFFISIAAANVIAWPAAYFVMGGWLRNFTVRTSLGAGTFLLAAFLAVAVAFLTVCFKSVKAALADPVESLRYE